MGNEDKKVPAELDRLQAEKLQSEIDKNKAEQREIEKRTQEIEKRLNQRMIFGIPVYQTIVGGFLAGAFIITFSWTFLTPILKKDSEIARKNAELLNIENKLERASLDSLNIDLTAQRDRLEKQVVLITARIDSTQKRDEERLQLANNALKKERSKVQSDKSTINNLLAQISGLKEDIKSTQNEKEQIKKITESPFWSDAKVQRMLVGNNFFDRRKNPDGLGIKHQYELKTINNEPIIIDHATNLTWQKAGTDDFLNYDGAEAYIHKLRRDKFAGFDDWRLPTLAEAMTLMEPVQKNGDLFIDSIFDPEQRWIWTSDKRSASNTWVVVFYYGNCDDVHVNNRYYVRAVR